MILFPLLSIVIRGCFPPFVFLDELALDELVRLSVPEDLFRSIGSLLLDSSSSLSSSEDCRRLCFESFPPDPPDDSLADERGRGVEDVVLGAGTGISWEVVAGGSFFRLLLGGVTITFRSSPSGCIEE